jgi:hypothetical protein
MYKQRTIPAILMETPAFRPFLPAFKFSFEKGAKRIVYFEGQILTA